jgi:histone acetyltransferase (RNA polymerase elongator complex component)
METTPSPLILPVFLPHLGCPERCLFCNQQATARSVPSPQAVWEFVEASLNQFPSRPGGREKQVAFYGGSFTAMRQEDQVSYLEVVHPFLLSRQIDSIRISTRPDALNEKVLTLLKEYGVKTVEVGAQSMVDDVLLQSKRGHCAEDSFSAFVRLKDWGFEAGVHLMIGLPGDTCNYFLESLDRLINLKPDFVRIHPTLVLKGSSLATLWKSGEYSPLTLSEAVDWLKKGMLRLERASITVARIGLQPARELEEHFLAGPLHPSLRHLVDSAIFYDMAAHLLRDDSNDPQPVFVCHPRDLSALKGQRNGNILGLKNHFHLTDVLVCGNQDIPRGGLMLQTQKGEVSIDRTSLPFFSEFSPDVF